ncbi:hypothetical protein LMUR_03823 [Listeria grayi FSL F6-1183]|uniref:DUF6884 domain-containing protein n=1 Tax=Listeria grayi FSL F6-1183 TaxID=1265827 RepID=A0A829R8M5_LISGR|nr:hypothetical protein LMUR_03823 [Listeria grayi FSL F6-1183]
MMIIPSGKPKIWDKQPEKGPVPAKEAYTGTFHRLCRGYAEMLGESYLILSPKYGFLKPDDLVTGSYDVRFDYNGVNAETISLPELQAGWKQLEINQEVIVMLGGKKIYSFIGENCTRTAVCFSAGRSARNRGNAADAERSHSKTAPALDLRKNEERCSDQKEEDTVFEVAADKEIQCLKQHQYREGFHNNG